MCIMKKLFNVLLAIVILATAFCGCKNEKYVDENTAKANTTMLVTKTTKATATSTTEPTQKETTTTTTTKKKLTTTKQNISTTKIQTTTAVTKKVTTTQKPTTTETTTTRQEMTTVNGCASGNHSMGVGNIGRWFNSRNELDNYFSSTCTNWGNKYHNGEITRDEYIKNCPQGYKSWSCSICGKWTGNFTY